MKKSQAQQTPRYTIKIEAPANGRIRKAKVTVIGSDGKIKAMDRGDLQSIAEQQKIAKRLAARLGDVTVPQLLGLIDAKWRECNDEHRRVQELAAKGSAEAAPSTEPPERTSAASRMVELAFLSGAEFFHDAEHKAFASIPVAGHLETQPLRSATFKRWLGRLIHVAEGRVAGSQALQDAIGVLEGKAIFDGLERSVHVRLTGYADKIYLDLADSDWQMAEIDASGWRVVSAAPVRFRRPRGLLPLPLPKRGGSIDELKSFINLANEGDHRLLIAWLLASLRPSGPYPILCLSGQQGSAKSTHARILRSLVDPNIAPLRSEPRDPRDLMIAAHNAAILAYDNLSGMSGWLSDALCCLSTGGGWSTRELYANDEETIFSAMRPVVLTAIEDVATRGDLLDRAILLNLPEIPDGKRMPEAALWKRFDAVRPRILGALLTHLSGALRELPSVRLKTLPRMADFALLGVAVERAQSWPPGSFLEAYLGNRSDAHELALEASLLVPFVRQLLQAKSSWSGTASELLVELKTLAGETVAKSREWPGNAKALSGRLKRLAPNLRGVGVLVEWKRGAGQSRKRIISLHQDNERILASGASAASADARIPAENESCSDARGRTEGDADATPDARNQSKTARQDAKDAKDARKQSQSDEDELGHHETPWG